MGETNMPVNIIFDIGGVVINFDPKGYLAQNFPQGDHAQKLYDAVFGSPEWDLFDRGDISFAQAAQVFTARGDALGLAAEMAQTVADAFDLLSTRPTMAALIQKLHGLGVPMYYLSNMSPEVKDLMGQRDFWHLFSGGIASSDVGLLKPDPAFYLLLLERYGLTAAECLFMDDTPANVKAAKQLGFDARHFTGDDVLLRALAEKGIEL
ncbi:HAD family phosphatase [Clostridia bacterium OttesenSCG-928-O13]|nr:HAD family phosphatase [Clostridia bacterium OttesenSCG-928-O13]